VDDLIIGVQPTGYLEILIGWVGVWMDPILGANHLEVSPMSGCIQGHKRVSDLAHLLVQIAIRNGVY
jgi:hypothetical protein